jgi:hypothetical protein
LGWEKTIHSQIEWLLDGNEERSGGRENRVSFMERDSSEEDENEDEEAADQMLQSPGKNHQSSLPRRRKVKVKSSIQET